MEYAVIRVDGSYDSLAIPIHSQEDAIKAYEVRKMLCVLKLSYSTRSGAEYTYQSDAKISLLFTTDVDEAEPIEYPISDEESE